MWRKPTLVYVGEVTIIVQPISLLIYNDLITVMTSQLLVTVDSLRYDHFHLMENTREYLDQEHESAFSVSTATGGSFPGIICSSYPTKLGINHLREFTSEIDKYRIGITTNHLLSERYGYGKSFDYFECPRKSDEELKSKIARNLDDNGLVYRILTLGWNAFQNIRKNFKSVDDTFRTSDDVIDRLLDKIEDKENWFAWIHLMEPHHPYEPENGDGNKIEYQNKTRKVINGNGNKEDKNIVKDGYKNEIIELDQSLQRLWNSIPEDTETIFTSDHGELLGEYDDSWGHIGMMVPELLHIPFATKNVDVSERDIVSHIDIGSLFLNHEFGEDEKDREYAYATYSDKKAIISSDLIFDGKNTINMDGEKVKDFDTSDLEDKLAKFNPGGTQYRKEGLKEDLEDLGYI